jgi:4-amino-4-deoxy-L-arabinose transferase-like glycosyltransferase
MKLKRNIIILSIIVGIGFLLRFIQVANNPPALSWDEVSIGYNAYSILKTGMDEHGKFMPLDAFIGYGDYKPPLSIYITVPFVALFGLNEFSVRLPSVLFGTGVVALIYYVIQELFLVNVKDKKKSFNQRIPLIGLVTSFSIAVSPWHINLSRAGFEANIGLFFILLGVYLVLVARKHERMWTYAWLPFVASIYTFNSSRYFAPFVGLALVFYCWKHIVHQKKYVAIGIVVAMFTMVPIVPHLLSKEARLRFTEVNIFSDLSVVTQSNERITLDDNSFVGKILHNRRIGFARSFLIHYFDNFSPDFLFIKGDGNPKFSIQDVGQMYIIDIPFLLLGIYFVFTYFRREALFLLFWLLTAIIPAATARETPHALRILNSLPVWHIWIGFGLVTFLSTIVQNRKRIITIVVCLGYMVSISYYIHNYYVHYPRMYSNEWQYGYKQALEYVRSHDTEYKKIYLTESIGRAYMYTLFYSHYDPAQYLKLKKSYFDAAGFYHVDGFDKYIFTSVAPTALEDSSLYIFPPGQMPEGAIVRKTIPLLNGDPVLVLFDKN